MKKSDEIVQKTLNRLISEEWMASVMYNQFVMAVKNCEERKYLKDLFKEIEEDERDDHYDKLVSYALKNDFTVPCMLKEYEKYAGKETVKQFKSWKKSQKAGYYIDEAIKSEIEAIGSYEEAMQEENIPFEFLQVIIPNYYDEQEHFSKISSLKIVYETGADYVYCK